MPEKNFVLVSVYVNFSWKIAKYTRALYELKST